MLQNDTKRNTQKRNRKIRKNANNQSICFNKTNGKNRRKEIVLDEHGLDWAEKWVKRWGDNWRLH